MPTRPAWDALRQWSQAQGRGDLPAPLQAGPAPSDDRASEATPTSPVVYDLAGPTGEQNLYERLPPRAVLCMAGQDADLITQLAAVLAIGSHAVWDGQHDVAARLYPTLPAPVREHVTLSTRWLDADFNVALHHGDTESLRKLLRKLADREGVIVPVVALKDGDASVPLERLVRERAISINTAAAGGNASLMTMA